MGVFLCIIYKKETAFFPLQKVGIIVIYKYKLVYKNIPK